jgi:hypothetical protein
MNGLPEDEHDDRLDGGGLQVVVGVPHVLQGHPVELALVDVRYLQVEYVKHRESPGSL